MKIYTSYFGNMRRIMGNNLTPICIARGVPKFFYGAKIQTVAPHSWMLGGNISREEYIRAYWDKVLSRVDPNQFIEECQRLSNGKDVALCCYEKPTDFCHRHILAKWLEEKLGIEVIEFDVIGEPWNPKNPKVEQLSLFDD